MGKGVFIAGLILAVLGILWSILLFAVFVGLTALTLGGLAGLLLVPVVGFLAGLLAIVGSILARGEGRRGGALLLFAGVLGTLGPPAITLVNLGETATLESLLGLTLLSGWWAIGLVLVGIVGIRKGRRE